MDTMRVSAQRALVQDVMWHFLALLAILIVATISFRAADHLQFTETRDYLEDKATFDLSSGSFGRQDSQRSPSFLDRSRADVCDARPKTSCGGL